MQPGKDGLKLDWERLHWLCSHSWLGIDVENMRSASGAIVSSEGSNHAKIQLFDPFDWSVKAIAQANGEVGKLDIFLISFRVLLKGFLVLGNLPLKVFDFFNEGLIGVLVGKVFDLEGVSQLLGNGLKVLCIHVSESLQEVVSYAR